MNDSLENYLVAHFVAQKYDRFMQKMNELPQECRSLLVNKYIKNNMKSMTYLSVACQRLNMRMVRYLLQDCKADPEIEVQFYHDENRKATILWHLANHESQIYIPIIRHLVKFGGAEVDSKKDTITNSTPLMVACLKNKIQTVKFLLEYGKAKINECDVNGENCLFYAVKGNDDCYELVQYLVENKVDVNKFNNQGHSAIYFTLNHENNDIFYFLLDRECAINNTISLDSYLLTTALNGDVSKYNAIYLKNVPKELRIIGNEIIGAILCEKSDLIQFSYIYWHLSLKERGDVLKKPLRHIPGFAREFSTESDLQRIEKYAYNLCLQTLWIRERILCKFKTIHRLAEINVYKALHVDSIDLNRDYHNQGHNIIKNRKRLETLWQYALGIQLKFCSPLNECLMFNLLDLISFLYFTNSIMSLSFDSKLGLKIIKACLHEIIRIYNCIKSNHLEYYLEVFHNFPQNKKFDLAEAFKFEDLYDLNDPQLGKVEINYVKMFTAQIDRQIIKNGLNCLFRVSIMAIRLLTKPENFQQLSDHSKEELKLLTKRLIFIDKKSSFGETLMEMAFKPALRFNRSIHARNYEIKVETTNSVSLECVSFLLECGADPNSKQTNLGLLSRNTCFNKSLFESDVSKEKCERLIQAFLKHGAHLDQCNDNNQTAMMSFKLKFNTELNLIAPIRHLSLKCLCSYVILRENLIYEKILPNELIEFVKIH